MESIKLWSGVAEPEEDCREGMSEDALEGAAMAQGVWVPAVVGGTGRGGVVAGGCGDGLRWGTRGKIVGDGGGGGRQGEGDRRDFGNGE